MNTKVNKDRILYYDLLNIFAIIAVLFMHCNGIVHDTPIIKEWDFSLFIDCIMYWAVPIFFMLSGATLLTYRDKYNTKTFFKKRFQKVLIPFLFWAGIMFIWKTWTNQLVLPDDKIFTLFNAFLKNKEEPTYYFVFEILGLYLTMPALSLLLNKYKKILFPLIISLITINVAMQVLSYYLKFTIIIEIIIQFIACIIYALLGFYLSKNNINKVTRIFIYILGIAGVLFRFITTYSMSKTSEIVVKTTWGYDKLHCIFLAISVFLIFKNINFKNLSNNEKISNLLSNISNCTFGIYLIHFIPRYYLIKLFNINITSLFFRIICPIIVYLISLMIVFLLKKIPFVRRIVS